MFPPDITQTIGPLSTLPVRAAAKELAPEPSATTRCRSNRIRTAEATSFKLTTIEPAASGLTRSHISGRTSLSPVPSRKLGIRSTCFGDPAA
jgi:hypothetical protein